MKQLKVSVQATVLMQLMSQDRIRSSYLPLRGVGLLLGRKISDYNIVITNSFEVPFKEESLGSEIWYVDQSYLKRMLKLFELTNSADEVTVGWYHDGKVVFPNDLQLHDYFARYISMPIMLLVDVSNSSSNSCVVALTSQNVVINETLLRMKRVFQAVSCKVVMDPAEKIALAHLRKSVPQKSVTHFTKHYRDNFAQLKLLIEAVGKISAYLRLVAVGKMHVNNQINYLLQSIFNILLMTNMIESNNLFFHQRKIMTSMCIAALTWCFSGLDRSTEQMNGFENFVNVNLTDNEPFDKRAFNTFCSSESDDSSDD